MRIPSKIADRGEQLIAVIFYIWLVVRLVGQGRPDIQVWAVLIAEVTILAFLLMRRATDGISMNLQDWLVAVVGTCASLLIRRAAPSIDGNVGLALVLLGTGIAVASKLALRRSFGLVAANRGVKVGGLYGLVRHPMYAGYMVSHVGIMLMWPSVWNLGVYIVTWAALVARIGAEERLLTQDAAYAAYRQRVRYRLVPGLF